MQLRTYILLILLLFNLMQYNLIKQKKTRKTVEVDLEDCFSYSIMLVHTENPALHTAFEKFVTLAPEKPQMSL